MVPDGSRLETIQSNFISNQGIEAVEIFSLRRAGTRAGETHKQKRPKPEGSGLIDDCCYCSQRVYQRMSATVRPAGMNGSTCSV